jgi:hypothetical protein
MADKMCANPKDEKSSEPTVVTAQMHTELKEELARLKAESSDYTVGFVGLSEIRFKDEKPRKPMVTLSFEELIGRRDWLIQKWEPDCPEILASILSARNPIAATDALLTRVVRDSPVKPGFLQAPHKCASQLWLFLLSGRFKDSLRNLANATAGLPEMGWKRSFDLCGSDSPDDRLPVDPRAYRNFLKRNSSDRLIQLESARSVVEVEKILAKSRSKHPVFLAMKALLRGCFNGWQTENLEDEAMELCSLGNSQ